MSILETRTRKLLYALFFIIQFWVIVALLRSGRLDYIKDVLFVTLLIAIYILLEDKYSLSISNYIRGCILLMVTLHNFAGKYIDLYSTSMIFDKVLHVFGIYSIVLFVFSFMNQTTTISFTSRLNKFIFILLVGISLGAIFEIIEYITDITLNPRIHNQPDLIDTDLDLVSDVIGSLIAALQVCFLGVKQRL